MPRRFVPLKDAPPTAAQVARRKLVEAPFPVVRTVPTQKSWAGYWVPDWHAYFTVRGRYRQDESDGSAYYYDE